MLLIGNICLCWFRKSFGEPKRYANRYRNAHVKPERMARLPKPYGAALYARRREDDLEERILPGVALRRQFLNKLSPLTSIVATYPEVFLEELAHRLFKAVSAHASPSSFR